MPTHRRAVFLVFPLLPLSVLIRSRLFPRLTTRHRPLEAFVRPTFFPSTADGPAMAPITDPDIEAYCTAHSAAESTVLQALRDATLERTAAPQMMVGPLEGSLLRLLVRSTAARRIIEVGTFTGYSALMMAEGLPEDGEVVTLDIDPETAAIAEDFWRQSPHGAKIAQVMGDARETLPLLEGPFDLAFIDADKTGYLEYWEHTLPLMRPGGLIIVDNVLWDGSVLAPETEDAKAVAAFNERVLDDPRVEAVTVPVRDGLLLAYKR